MRRTLFHTRKSTPAPVAAAAPSRAGSSASASASSDGGARPAMATLEEFVSMSAMLETYGRAGAARPVGLDQLYRAWGLGPLDWAQISAYWAGMFAHEPQLGEMFAERLRGRVNQLDLEWTLARS